MPGAAAPDGRLANGYLVERLGADFCIAWFGAEGPKTGWPSFPVLEKPLLERYGVRDKATYVFRPDGHVLARCEGIDPKFAEDAISAVLSYRNRKKASKARRPDVDSLYDELAAFVDALPAAERSRALARLAVALAHRLGDVEQAREAIRAAGRA